VVQQRHVAEGQLRVCKGDEGHGVGKSVRGYHPPPGRAAQRHGEAAGPWL
jgi:hypothetical protein